MTGGANNPVLPKPDDKLVDSKLPPNPNDRVTNPEVTPDAGATAAEAFHNQLASRSQVIEPGDKTPYTVKPYTMTGANGEQIQGTSWNQGRDQFVMTNAGDKYRIDTRGDQTVYTPMPNHSGVRPPDVPPVRSAAATQTGDQGVHQQADPIKKGPTGNDQPVAPVTDQGRRTPAVTNDTGTADLTHRPPVAPDKLTTATANIDNQFTTKERNALHDVMGAQDFRQEQQRISKLPEAQQAAEWAKVQTQVRDANAGSPDRVVTPTPDHRVVPPVADHAVVDKAAVAPVVDRQAAAAIAQRADLGDQQRLALQHANDQALKGQPRDQQQFTPGDFGRKLQPTDGLAPGKDLVPRAPVVDGNDRAVRLAAQSQQDQLAAAQRQLGDHGRDKGDTFQPNRDIKLPGDQGQRGTIDMKQVQDMMRQQKDQPFPPGFDQKLKNNPDALAALQQNWKDARDREGKMGDLAGLRGQKDGGDQSSHGLDALKGSQNQKGIPGFDLNDKGTRDFLNDAMKRLEMTKGQKVDDIFKGLDPAKAASLTKFLTDGSADGKFNPARVKDFMGMADQFKNPTERLYDFLKVNKDLINNQQLAPKDTQRMLGDLTKILGDVNKQFGLDGTKNAFNIQDILGRKLDPTRPGERLAAMELNGINRQFMDRPDALALTARMTAAQEIALRQMLDLRNGKDPIAQPTVKLAGQDGLQGGRQTGARFEGPEGKLDAAQMAAQNAAKMDALNRGEKPDLPGKAEAKETTTGKPESAAQRQQDIALPGSKLNDGKADKPDTIANVDRKEDKYLDEKEKQHKKAEEEKEKERHQKEEQHKRDEKARLDALMVAALAEKKRKLLEQEQKEKEKSEEKDKQRDREKRRRYIVREKDTLQSIASQQLRDVKMAPLIYEINKEVIQLRVENGKQVPDLKPKMIIWLPSTTEIEEYRKGGIAGAKAAGMSQDKKMTADEELTARFGTGWTGGNKAGGPATGGPASGTTPPGGVPTTIIPGTQPATSAEVTAALAASAMEAAQKKRANIESLLGPVGRAKPVDGRIKYIARLGDSLKSVAMKHPALQDVSLWKLVAEINGISTEVDSRGTPVATLSRGAVLLLPSNIDIENFRQRAIGAPGAVHTASGAKTAGVITEVATKLCNGCNRMTVDSATICPACGNAFEISEKDDEGPSPDTNNGQDDASSEEVAITETLPPEDAKTVFVAPTEGAAEDARTTFVAGTETIEQLNEVCRLVKCDGQGLIGQLEVLRGQSWEPVVSYEVYDDVSLRNEHTQDGRKRTVRIDLPPPAARELANNDLHSNWKQYCSRFLGAPVE